ncbi:Trypsin [Amycolatopsis xylanica]|uniref:Trypsin n=1 Tax=Amycolatopsis xylanica TaxID=589385 RepID=A0A1H2S2L2_9PSEU|nr:Trypsin [Amycolatopsis xylanica]
MKEEVLRARSLVSAVSLVCVTAGATPAFAVAHGSDVPPGQFGFAAKLTMTGIPRPNGTTYSSACSGSLVSPQWVLTSSHCFHDIKGNPVSGPSPYPTTVTVGRTDEADAAAGATRQVVRVVQATGSPAALVQLDAPVTGVTPLVVRRTVPALHEKLTLAGWGSTEKDAKASTKLQQGTVEVGTIGEKTLGVRGVAPSTMTSACRYDSGAPYFVGQELVSIESSGPDCPHDKLETTVRADVLADWIGSQTTQP